MCRCGCGREGDSEANDDQVRKRRQLRAGDDDTDVYSMVKASYVKQRLKKRTVALRREIEMRSESITRLICTSITQVKGYSYSPGEGATQDTC